MAVSPFDRRKKTRRAQLEDVDQQALSRFKTANKMKARFDGQMLRQAEGKRGQPGYVGYKPPGNNPGYRPAPRAPYPMPRVRGGDPPGIEREGHLDKYKEPSKRLLDAWKNRTMKPQGTGRQVNWEKGNPREGQKFTKVIDRLGRKVHDYGPGKQKIVVGTKKEFKPAPRDGVMEQKSAMERQSTKRRRRKISY